ncbi:MAG: cyclic pyranopterin monophosphate synthase MoaC [Planctomycetota bacterium]
MSSGQPSLSHIGPDGEANMVDVGGKPATLRVAKASGIVRMDSTVLDELLSGELPKGDALSTARIAGITAAKRTHEWIPLCHPLPLDWIQIAFERASPEVLRIDCTAKATARTGVEMEALTGVCAAALTIYDMAKSADKGIVLGPFQLDMKTGGKSGDYHRR